MPATPAWPPRSLPRLFVEKGLAIGEKHQIIGQKAHYLINVMRLGNSDQVILCDDKTGEYRARILSHNRKAVLVEIEDQTRLREKVPDLWLCAAPIKKERWYWLAQKACELGIRRLQPVRTDRTIIDKVKPAKLRTYMIEAAEQCERTALPEIVNMVTLEQALASWPPDRTLFFADERLHATNTASSVEAICKNTGPAGILIGPEGGFTDAENMVISNHDSTVPISLGPRILRAETAALAAISLWMGCQGDWAKG